MPLTRLDLTEFTVFDSAGLRFGRDLNIFVGENGSGKTHILKAAYAALAVIAKQTGAPGEGFTHSQWEAELASKLLGVFRPDSLGHLVRRGRSRAKAEIRCQLAEPHGDLVFSFTRTAKGEVSLQSSPKARSYARPVYLPTRELLSLSAGFVALYETTHLPFEETWRDTSILLGAPLRKEHPETPEDGLLPLEEALGGPVELDQAGRFQVHMASGPMEIHLVAEGLRKLAMVARLIRTGAFPRGGFLFWDEPESNLNPRLLKVVAKSILQLSVAGVQVFVATHSLFLLRELHILSASRRVDTQCFGLHLKPRGPVTIQQGATMDEIGDIAALNEDLEQSDRYLETQFVVPGAQ